jgi:hypothetical protein
MEVDNMFDNIILLMKVEVILYKMKEQLTDIPNIEDKESLLFGVINILNPEHCTKMKSVYTKEYTSDHDKRLYFMKIQRSPIVIKFDINNTELNNRINVIYNTYNWSVEGDCIEKLVGEYTLNGKNPADEFLKTIDIFKTEDYTFCTTSKTIIVSRDNHPNPIVINKLTVNMDKAIRASVSYNYHIDDIRFCVKCGRPIQHGWHNTTHDVFKCGDCSTNGGLGLNRSGWEWVKQFKPEYNCNRSSTFEASAAVNFNILNYDDNYLKVKMIIPTEYKLSHGDNWVRTTPSVDITFDRKTLAVINVNGKDIMSRDAVRCINMMIIQNIRQYTHTGGGIWTYELSKYTYSAIHSTICNINNLIKNRL